MSEAKTLILNKFPKFFLGNTVGTIVDTVVLWLFSHLVFSNYVGQVIISPIISFECAVFANFVVAYHFVWGDRVKERNTRLFFRRYAGYNASRTGGFLIKMGVLVLIQHLSHWDVVICNLLALCVSGGFNFMMEAFVVFKKKKEASHGTDYNG